MASHVAYRNVIALRGFCITPKEQLLVYPIMENRSVVSCLRDRPKTQPPLEWPLRKRIALGAASGLSYLHHDCMRCIIHRDVKAANILLDYNFDAIVADFTLAKFMDCYGDDGLKGTIGHIAPEYLATGKCSVKSDVFGYGLFLLELITGQKIPRLRQLANKDRRMLHDWVNKLCEDKNMEAMVDPDLEGNFIEDEVQKLLHIALICTRHDPDERPMMFEVVRMLEDRARDGVAERWGEFLKNESMKLLPLNSLSMIDDNIADELSGPR